MLPGLSAGRQTTGKGAVALRATTLPGRLALERRTMNRVVSPDWVAGQHGEPLLTGYAIL